MSEVFLPFGFKVTEAEEKHSTIWSRIFEDERWASTVSEMGLNPVLGKDLHYLWKFEKSTRRNRAVYLILLLGKATEWPVGNATILNASLTSLPA